MQFRSFDQCPNGPHCPRYRTCGASTSLRSIPRPGTADCSPTADPAGHSTTDTSAASALPIALKVKAARIISRYATRTPRTLILSSCLRWLKDLVASDVRIVTQNGLYDWGWLRTDAGIKMPPSDRLEEIGALATIVDENRY